MGMAVALGAPWCDLLLVRVDPAAPHHLALVQRRLHGDEFSHRGRRFKAEVNRLRPAEART